MTSRPYGQFCGIARAFEIIGPRWSALIVRDLIRGPKRLSDLRETMPQITTSELDELEAAGVVRRSPSSSSESSSDAVYELTDYGRDLEPILLELGRWGARALGDPRQGDIFSLEMAILALRATFRPDRARDVRASFEVRFGDVVVNAKVADGVLTVGEGPLPGADLVIDTPVLKHLMAAELSPADALWLGLVDVDGDHSRLHTFVQLFQIPPAPQPLHVLPAGPSPGHVTDRWLFE